MALVLELHRTAIAVVDNLTRNQQTATYHAIACALLDEDEPPPALTAVIEGAATPDAASRIKAELGISYDYFVAIPPDPSDADAQRMLDELLAATRDL